MLIGEGVAEKFYRSLPRSFSGAEQFAYLAVGLNLDERESEYKFGHTASSKGRYNFGVRGRHSPPK